EITFVFIADTPSVVAGAPQDVLNCHLHRARCGVGAPISDSERSCSRWKSGDYPAEPSNSRSLAFNACNG
ncbi:MAG TPA: hypothetical protein VNH18_19505, partial [Bryobacteraceae bacterium]|nr:hypothetical protein [Bryobacteraceae bacterium]